jgi:dTDP-4-amino-4,6-dideoxygalactose transaminase
VGDWPAILHGKPLRAGKSWPTWPQHDQTERRLLEATLESGKWSSIRGEKAERLAAEFATFQDGRYGLPLANGSLTLEAALGACEVGEGDEVIVPALTFVTTATAVLAVNGTPVFVDVDPESLCLDVAAAEATVTERTRAVIAVHLAGTACDLDALVDLCERRGLALIEDCAHAHGTRWRGRGVGSFGSFGSFSFQEGKLMTAGEGGALVTNDEGLRDRAWSYANCGRTEQGHWLDHVTYGTNMRMTEWQGAVLQAQLQRLPEQNRVRDERARLLDAELGKIPGLRAQSGDPRMDSRSRYSYVFHYDSHEFAGLPLPGFIQALRHEGIVAGRSYRCLNTLELFRESRFGRRLRASAPRIDYGSVSLPQAEKAAESTVWLDHRLLLAEPDDVLDIVRAASRIRAHAGAVKLRTSRPVMLGGRIARGTFRRKGPTR